MFYAKSTSGFYDREIHGDAIPGDAVEITAEEYLALMEAQSSGRRIQADGSGKPMAVDPPPPTPNQIVAAKVAMVQAFMDAKARELNYDDIKTAVTYADEPAVAKFQAEGLAFRAWRSLVWSKCYEILNEVNAGSRDAPTDEELIADLPPLELPGAA